MIKDPGYRKRRQDTMCKYLRKALNSLQMRDWGVDLEVGDEIPKRFASDDDGDCVARVFFDSDTLHAFIWVSPGRCKVDGVDPLNAMYHEIAHIFHIIHNEEVWCNVLALLISNLLA